MGLGRRDAAGLDVATHADAALLAAGLGFRLAGGEAVIVDRLHCRIERSLVVAGIILEDHRCLIRPFPDEVLAAQFGRRNAELARRRFDDPLQRIGRFGPTGPR